MLNAEAMVSWLKSGYSLSNHHSPNFTVHHSYDAQSAVALVRAAERTRSPAILQMFPVTLAYGKGPFLRFCLDM
jgi:hypothetical protein